MRGAARAALVLLAGASAMPRAGSFQAGLVWGGFFSGGGLRSLWTACDGTNALPKLRRGPRAQGSHSRASCPPVALAAASVREGGRIPPTACFREESIEQSMWRHPKCANSTAGSLAANCGTTYVGDPRPCADSHSATVIWLHGLGDDGCKWSKVAREMDMPWTRFIFPSAPVRRTRLRVRPTTAWFNIKSLRADEEEVDELGIFEAAAFVDSMVAAEVEQGIPTERVALVGFSMGGTDMTRNTPVITFADRFHLLCCAPSCSVRSTILHPCSLLTRLFAASNRAGAVALAAALHTSKTLGAVATIGSWLPLCVTPSCTRVATPSPESTNARDRTLSPAPRHSTPILMCHGDADKVVAFEWGKASAQRLAEAGMEPRFSRHRGVGHEATSQQVREVAAFLRSALPPSEVGNQHFEASS